MNTGSFLFRELSEEELERCAQHYLGEALVDYRLLTDGLFNTTYRLDTPTRSVILRLGPVNRHLLLAYEHNLMEAEVAVQKLMKAHGIPTSETLILDTSRTFLNRDVAIVSRIEGFNMGAVSLKKSRIDAICKEVGSLVRRIHEISPQDLATVPQKPFGRCSMVLSGKGNATWSEAILEEVHLWRVGAQEADLFPPEILDRMEACFRRFAPVLDEITEPRLVHGDLWYGNILVAEGDRIAALIDADRAFFGDPQIDLLCSYVEKKPFLEGYGPVPGSRKHNALRQKLYAFLLMLEDCHVLKTEYNKPGDFRELRWLVLSKLEELEKEEWEGA